ncbi:MAG: hypothetical protein JRI91_04180 [Deltaproteobacteria bacterium]|nr:hypothetical protein [Deltaproteobacteria bacterium]
MKKIFSFLLLCLSCSALYWAAMCWAEPGKLDFPVDEKKMLEGELQIFERSIERGGGKKKKHIAGVILINASPEEVWNVLNDWESMDEFVPDLEYYKVISESRQYERDGIGQVFIEGKLNIPLFDFIYNLDVVSDKSCFLQKWRLMTPEEVEIIRLVGFDIRKSTDGIDEITGYGLVQPADNGQKSIYTYSTVIEFSMPLPEFVENYICRNALTGFIEGVKKRVESHGLYIKNSSSLF